LNPGPGRKENESGPARDAKNSIVKELDMKMGHFCRGAVALAILAALGAVATPPTFDELKNATYRGIDLAGGAVTLSDGRWEGKPASPGSATRFVVTLVQDLFVAGDLDGDGSDEAAVLLGATSGGSGSFTYLAVMGRKNGKPVNLGTALLGDRVQVRGMKIQEGRVFVELVQAGPEDAACCPGDLATRGWALHREGLEEFVSTTKSGRLSLEAMAGTEWVLRSWDLDKPAGTQPEVTLRFEEGRFAGSSGCNHYFATVAQGSSPGDLSVGPVGATRMACQEPAMEVETRYLGLLEGAKKFGFRAGRLALTCEKDGASGVLLFEARRDRPAR
jgi:heat shock protein HslJ